MRRAKVLIIENDRTFRMHLHLLLFWYCRKYLLVVGEAHTVAEGIRAVQQYQPDIIILDTDLPDGSGFAVLDAFREEVLHLRYHTLVCSSDERHRSQAFRYRAVDYVMKDFLWEHFIATFVHLFEVMNADIPDQSDQVFILPTKKNGFVHVIPQTVVCVKARKNGTVLVLNNGTEVAIDLSLQQVEEEFGQFGFLRVRHSSLVNMGYVQRANSLSNSKKATLDLLNGATMAIGRTYLPSVRAYYVDSPRSAKSTSRLVSQALPPLPQQNHRFSILRD